MSTFTKQKTYRLSLHKCALIIFQLGNIQRGSINLFLYVTVTKIQLTTCNGGLTDARSSLGPQIKISLRAPNCLGPALLWQAVSSCRRRNSEVPWVMRRMLHTSLSRDFTLCDCVEMWRFPITHWILTDRVTADWHEESSTGWMSSNRSGNKGDVSCMNSICDVFCTVKYYIITFVQTHGTTCSTGLTSWSARQQRCIFCSHLLCHLPHLYKKSQDLALKKQKCHHS